MPVLFTKNLVPSNKQGKKESEKAILACGVKGMGHVYVQMPRVDKLTFTCKVIPSDEDGIRDLLGKCPGQVAGFEKIQKGAIGDSGHTKWHSAHKVSVLYRPPGSKETILIQAAPLDPKQSFLRFEMNPHRLGLAGLEAFKTIALPAFLLTNYSYSTLLSHGKVTRIDAAIDLVGLRRSRLVADVKAVGKKTSWTANDGSVETETFGHKKGPQPASPTIYDKRRALVDQNLEPEFGPLPHTRVEFRLALGKGIPFAKLAAISNPVTSVQLFAPGSVAPPESRHHWRLFEDSCRHRGVGGALGLLPADERTLYEKALLDAEIKVWKADRIWAHWPEAVALSGILNP